MDDFLNGRKYLNPVLTKQTDIIIKSAKGIYITDILGNRYIDLVQGIATNPLGHCHPRIVSAINKQCQELIGASFSYFDIPVTLELLNKLGSILPAPLDSILFSNSGGEANEGAIKLAKFHTKRQAVIGFIGAYHGRGYAATTFTTMSSSARSDCGSLLSDAYFLPYPARDQCPKEYKSEEKMTDYCLWQLHNIFKYLVAPDNVAAIIMEPILGDGGYFVPPIQFVRKISEICKKHGIMLIFDEVQTGYGRTGKMFACEHFGVIPDIMTLGKPMASGLPMSALVSKGEITKSWSAGKHGGSTFVGNPVSAAAALALLEEYEEAEILDNCCKMGDYFKERLIALKDKYSVIISEVRGIGLMLGVEFIDKAGVQSQEVFNQIFKILIKNNLVCARCGLNNGVMRLIPPLNITKEEIDLAVDIIDKSINEFLSA